MRNNFFQFNQDQDDSLNELFTNFNPSLKRNLRDFNCAVTVQRPHFSNIKSLISHE